MSDRIDTEKEFFRKTAEELGIDMEEAKESQERIDEECGTDFAKYFEEK